jgi:hypothetical protein
MAEKLKVPNEHTSLVYTSLKGTRVYAHKDITQISAFRGVAAEKAKRFASLCITHDELERLVNVAIEDLNKKQDWTQGMAILHEIRWRLNMITEENSLMDLACIYLMLEGEDIEKPSDEWNKKKRELCKGESDLRSFFLREALGLVGKFSQKQGADLLTYLEETSSLARVRISRFLESKP